MNISVVMWEVAKTKKPMQKTLFFKVLVLTMVQSHIAKMVFEVEELGLADVSKGLSYESGATVDTGRQIGYRGGRTSGGGMKLLT